MNTNTIPKIELAKPADIKSFQEDVLRKQLRYLQRNSPYYQRVFKEKGIVVENIQHLEDLALLPLTHKDDLQKHNDAFRCVPKNKIADYVTTSGTLGDPVTFALSDNDLDRLAYNESVSLACSGVRPGDVVQLMTTMDRRFMAGLAYFLGARKLGASMVRSGAGNPELQWDSIKRFQPKYLIAVPSFLLKMIAYAKEHGIDLKSCSVKAAICIGEPVRDMDFGLNTLGRKIKAAWDIALFSTYASTEMSTAFSECSAQRGGHAHPELIITEILDDTGNPVSEGELGELTFTTLGVEAMPLLRFQTGDIVREEIGTCSCGRTTPRLSPVVGRKQQMIKYKGTTLYPPALADVSNDFKEIENYLITVSHDDLGLDHINLKISSANPSEELLGKIKGHFQAKLRVLPEIEWYGRKELEVLCFPKTSRKAVRFVDGRM